MSKSHSLALIHAYPISMPTPKTLLVDFVYPAIRDVEYLVFDDQSTEPKTWRSAGKKDSAFGEMAVS